MQALLLPLHDPLRVAEDLAVLDLASGGRVAVTLGVGYRPEEYAAHGKSWVDRGKLMDEGVAALLDAWTGEPFEYRGTRVRVDARPAHEAASADHDRRQRARPGARRAARFGLPFAPPAYLPELEAYYYEQCAVHGTTGFVVSPPPDLALVFVSEDPDRSWAEIGPYFLHEATDLRRMADARHPVVGALARDHRRRAPRRGYLRDPHARAVPRACGTRWR